jgi:hypothetical protein
LRHVRDLIQEYEAEQAILGDPKNKDLLSTSAVQEDDEPQADVTLNKSQVAKKAKKSGPMKASNSIHFYI